jgi:hypothetical protein
MSTVDRDCSTVGFPSFAVASSIAAHIDLQSPGDIFVGVHGSCLLETCRRLGINPREYLLDVLPGLAERDQSEVA